MSTIPGLITEINPVSRLDVPANDLDLILPHWECTIGGGCELAPNCLTADNRPVLTPLGCFAGKTRITWFFGDRAKDCPK